MAYAIGLIIKNYLIIESCRPLDDGNCARFGYFTLAESFYVFLTAIFVGACHWSISIHNLVGKILNLMRAQYTDLRDTYHQMFQNIVEEVSVATGGIKIEAVVVPSMAMNAFALSDFNGRHVIGVTEGLLSRLSRSQIEAVVGHEAAHIVSGDCLATTVTTEVRHVAINCCNAGIII